MAQEERFLVPLPTCSTMRNQMNSQIPDGSMMWGMSAGGLLGLLVCALIIAALVKYVFFQ
jgi:hypothetical protein